MTDFYEVSLTSLGRTYEIPTRGVTDWRVSLSLYLRDLATVVNAGSSGSLVTPVFNVKTFGATGNGTTDDTAAIQSAMNALAVTGATGGTLYFPAGTYKYTSRLQFGVAVTQTNVKIVGDGPVSVLKPTGAFSTNPTIEFRDCPFWGVSDVKLDCSARTGTGDGILVDGSSYGTVARAVITGSSRYGINITRTNGAATPVLNYIEPSVVFSANTTAPWNALASGLRTASYATIDVRDFGVTANGSTDDTAAMQLALDWAYALMQVNAVAVQLTIPAGDIKISSTLVWKGTSAAAPSLVGEIPRADEFDGNGVARFRWYGAANGTMMYAQSCNKGLLRNLAFDGRSLAGKCLHLGASTYADPAVLAATSGIRVEYCAFRYVKIATVGNGCVALGTDPAFTGGDTFEQADVRFDNCTFAGEDTDAVGFTYAGMKAYGVKALAGGNCKLFSWNYCEWLTCDTALDGTDSSGPFNVLIASMGDCRCAFRHNDGNLLVMGGDIEGSHLDDFRLLVGTGGVGAFADLNGLEVAAYMSGAVGTLIEGGGQVTLRNSYLFNNNHSVSGIDSQPNPFKVITDADAVSVNRQSFKSENNWWVNCGNDYAFIPLFDGSANDLRPVAGLYGAEHQLVISSRGDRGGYPGSDFMLGEFDGNRVRIFDLTTVGPIELSYLSSGSTVDSGISNRTVLSIDATAAPQTYTLPAAATANLGRVILVNKRDSGANTVTVNSSVVLRAQGETAIFVSGKAVGGAAAWETYLQPADSTHPGTVTVGPQTWAGAKTFSSPITYKGTTTITAHAGGGQGSATALTAEVNYVTVVASSGDSVVLPTAALGLLITIFNLGANPMDVFPASGGQINAAGANTAVSLAAAASLTYYGQSTTQWRTK